MQNSKAFFAALGYASEVEVQSDKTGIAEDAVSIVVPDASVYMYHWKSLLTSNRRLSV